MAIPSIGSVEPFQTKDGSTIRELAHPVSEEIYHFTAGSGRMLLGDEEFSVEPGQAVVIPPLRPGVQP